MVTREITLINRLGLHARAAARLVQTASQFQCRITLGRDGQAVDAKSILGLLMLAGAMGDRLTLTADGKDESEALEALQGLIMSRFGETQ